MTRVLVVSKFHVLPRIARSKWWNIFWSWVSDIVRTRRPAWSLEPMFYNIFLLVFEISFDLLISLFCFSYLGHMGPHGGAHGPPMGPLVPEVRKIKNNIKNKNT